MTQLEFEKEYGNLGENPKTAVVDKFCKRLLREQVDVSFLREMTGMHPAYHRIYFQVSMGLCSTLDEKFAFLEDNFSLLYDWWCVDQLMVFLGDAIDFDYAYRKALGYIESDMPYVRRFGYVIFIPRLVRDKSKLPKLLALLKNETVYHVVMGEAWLLSYVAMCDPDVAFDYIKHCDLKYNIVGKAIQKICDSYVISDEDKERFKSLRAERKLDFSHGNV